MLYCYIPLFFLTKPKIHICFILVSAVSRKKGFGFCISVWEKVSTVDCPVLKKVKIIQAEMEWDSKKLFSESLLSGHSTAPRKSKEPNDYRVLATTCIQSWDLCSLYIQLVQPSIYIKIFAVHKKYLNVALEICTSMLDGRIRMAFSPKGTNILIIGSCHYRLC